jgi:hypothetical protein
VYKGRAAATHVAAIRRSRARRPRALERRNCQHVEE